MYIGDKLKGGGVHTYLLMHPTFTKVLFIAAAFITLVEIFSSVLMIGHNTAANDFGSRILDLNPLHQLSFLLRERPLAVMILLVISIAGGLAAAFKFLPAQVKSGPPAGSSNFYQGFRRPEDTPSPYGVSDIATSGDIQKSFHETTLTMIPGIPLGADLDTGMMVSVPYKFIDVNGVKNRHILLIGISGGGKTGRTILNIQFTALAQGSTGISSDPKAELYEQSLTLLAIYGYEAFVFNPDNPEISAGWDIVRSIRIAKDPEKRAYEMADTFLRNSVDRYGNNFWSLANVNLFTLAFLFVGCSESFVPMTQGLRRKDGNTVKADASQRNFREVAYFISNPDVFEKLVVEAMAKSTHDENLLMGNYKAWQQNKEQKQIASSLSTETFVYKLKGISDMLSRDDIRLDELGEGKKWIFVKESWCSDHFQAVTATFMSVFIAESEINSEKCGGEFPKPYFLIMEEFPTLGYIPVFGNAMANTRAYNINALICSQSLKQIGGVYRYNNECDAIINNCATWVCMETMDRDDAEKFSKLCGTKKGNVETRTRPVNEIAPEFIQNMAVTDVSISSRDEKMQVLPPDYFRKMPGDRLVAISAGQNPMILRAVYYKELPDGELYFRDKVTHEEVKVKATDYKPKSLYPDAGLYDTSRLEIRDRKMDKQEKEDSTEHIGWDKFLE